MSTQEVIALMFGGVTFVSAVVAVAPVKERVSNIALIVAACCAVILALVATG